MSVINSKLVFVACVFLAFGCGPQSPEGMAKQYCECFQAAEAGSKNLDECQALISTHREKLGKDPSLSRRYADAVVKCAVYERDSKGAEE